MDTIDQAIELVPNPMGQWASYDEPTGSYTNLDEADLPETEDEAQKVVKKKTTCISLVLRRMGTKRKVASTTEAIETETDRNLLLINKIIIDSPELEAITTIDGKIRSYIKRVSLPGEAMQRGCYLLPVSMVPVIDEKLVGFSKDREKLIEVYVGAYPQRMAEAQGRLGQLFDALDYLAPGDVKSTFRMEWTYLEPTVSSGLKEISKQIFDREIKKMGAKCQEMISQVESGLVDYMQEFVDHLITSLSIKDDGKPKIFRAAVVDNFRDFLSQLPQMNITGNEKIAELGRKAKAIMEGVDPKVLRKDLDVRSALQLRLKDLKTLELDPAIQDRPDRKFSFDD